MRSLLLVLCMWAPVGCKPVEEHPASNLTAAITYENAMAELAKALAIRWGECGQWEPREVEQYLDPDPEKVIAAFGGPLKKFCPHITTAVIFECIQQTRSADCTVIKPGTSDYCSGKAMCERSQGVDPENVRIIQIRLE